MPARRRELAAWFQATYRVKVQRACRLAQFSRTSWYRRSTRDDQMPLRLRIRELAHARPRSGFTGIWVLLRREGWKVNKKRVRRLLDGLQLRMRVRRRKHIALHRGPAPRPSGPTKRWSMDFVHDALSDGRPFRVLTVIEQWSRQSPLLEVAVSISGHGVGVALDRVLAEGAAPRSITVDHGTQFMSRALEDWAYARGVQLDFIRPGKPVEKRLHRGLQRTPPRRVLERPSVHIDRRRPRQDRSVAGRLQCAPTTQLARAPDTERVRCPTSGRTDCDRSGIF